MKKITQQQIQLILLFIIVVIGVCAYQFGYMNYVDKADEVKKQNIALQNRVDELNGKILLKSEYNEGAELSAKAAEKILNKYGPGNSPEKSIVFVRALEDKASLSVKTISFNEDVSMFASTEVDENGIPKVITYTSPLALTYSTSYEGLKKAFDFINEYPERMNVESFTAVFNQETGEIAGSLLINLYSVAAEGKEYKAPVVSGIEIGTDNIFGTVIVPVENEE